jgi:putative intracellular protease/amidase
VLRDAAAAGADVAVRLVAVSGAGEVVGAHGLRVRAEFEAVRDDRPDVLIVLRGGWVDRSPQGARAEAERGIVPRLLADFYEDGVTLAAVCTGAMLLASAGLLRGRPAVTHHELCFAVSG